MRISMTPSWAVARLGAFGMPTHALASTSAEVAPATKPRQYGDAGNGVSGASTAWGPPI